MNPARASGNGDGHFLRVSNSGKMNVLKRLQNQDFPEGPMVKNPSSNTVGAGSISGWELRSHMWWGNYGQMPELQSSHVAIAEPRHSGVHPPQPERGPHPTGKSPHTKRKMPCTTTKVLHARNK